MNNLSSYSLPEVDDLFEGIHAGFTTCMFLGFKFLSQQMIARVQSAYLPAQYLTSQSIRHGLTISVCPLQMNRY